MSFDEEELDYALDLAAKCHKRNITIRRGGETRQKAILKMYDFIIINTNICLNPEMAKRLRRALNKHLVTEILSEEDYEYYSDKLIAKIRDHKKDQDIEDMCDDPSDIKMIYNK
uniref:Uncharacterized protein n=1 Tax=Pithovirus LCPAC403 TaxID=2506596 RepID=A0A481ZAL0_9VIRU|nr:MAG: hypothetical protein LCPAC403_00820 [Pithovirus LCPAC403]